MLRNRWTMGYPIMELMHVMRFWMAIAILLGLHWNMNACVLVLHYWSRFLLQLSWVLAFCFPFSLVYMYVCMYNICLMRHVLKFPTLIQRKWKNDAHIAIRDCYAAREIDNSSYKALYYMSEALSQVTLLFELHFKMCSVCNNVLW